ncbi:Plasmid encoded restriction endonuclease Per [Geitlerinema sp. FC II]|nr:Plasmid encoded restriction endonuclease Per [Geitlerinema sp. FC II]
MDVRSHIFNSQKLQSVLNDAACFFESTPVYKMPPSIRFDGAGVYGIYYTGNFNPYQKLAAYNKIHFQLPIYIGKSVPRGYRQGRVFESTEGSRVLYVRLNEHARSLSQSSNLNISDFFYRFAILDGTTVSLIGALEATLIRKYKPLWNSYIDGFGNHDPGRGRYQQAKSEWDVLHPGREWAARLNGESTTLSSILDKVSEYEIQQ